MNESMHQIAPFAMELAELVKDLSYRPGWSFSLEDIERHPGRNWLFWVSDYVI